MLKMKKILKYLRQNIIGFIVDGIVFGSFGVYAATVIAASSVGYSDNSSLGADNVQSAIDKLNTKATTKIKEAKEECPEGKICKDPICRRAAILHTEICSNTDTTGYCQADSLNSKTVWLIYSNYRYVAHHNANVSSKHGVRPAIEVAKSNIDY